MRVEKRNRALLDLSHRLQECLLKVPSVCTEYVAEGCQPAHSNLMRHGKGKGTKAEDWFHVAACPSCHREIDQGHRLTRGEREALWMAGWERTMAHYWRQGWIKVA